MWWLALLACPSPSTGDDKGAPTDTTDTPAPTGETGHSAVPTGTTGHTGAPPTAETGPVVVHEPVELGPVHDIGFQVPTDDETHCQLSWSEDGTRLAAAFTTIGADEVTKHIGFTVLDATATVVVPPRQLGGSTFEQGQKPDLEFEGNDHVLVAWEGRYGGVLAERVTPAPGGPSELVTVEPSGTASGRRASFVDLAPRSDGTTLMAWSALDLNFDQVVHNQTRVLRSDLSDLPGAAVGSSLDLGLQPPELTLDANEDAVLLWTAYAKTASLQFSTLDSTGAELATTELYPGPGRAIRPHASRAPDDRVGIVFMIGEAEGVTDVAWMVAGADGSVLVPARPLVADELNRELGTLAWLDDDTALVAWSEFPATGPEQVKLALMSMTDGTFRWGPEVVSTGFMALRPSVAIRELDPRTFQLAIAWEEMVAGYRILATAGTIHLDALP